MSEDAIIAALAAAAAASGFWAWLRRRAVNNYRWALRKLGWDDKRIDRAVERAKKARAAAKKAGAK